jgi:hypothetical protein
MHRIHYAEGSTLTGSDIARAVLNYAEALAQRGTSIAVELPSRRDGGEEGLTTFLLGPASQIIAEAEESEFDEIVDPELVASFDREAAKLRVPRVETSEQPSADRAASESPHLSESESPSF